MLAGYAPLMGMAGGTALGNAMGASSAMQPIMGALGAQIGQDLFPRRQQIPPMQPPAPPPLPRSMVPMQPNFGMQTTKPDMMLEEALRRMLSGGR